MTPIVFYSGNDIEACRNLLDHNVDVISAHSRLVPRIQSLRDAGVGLPAHAEGALLRYEIPSLMADEDRILYADCDTYFFNNFTFEINKDFCVACIPTSEDAGGKVHYNSGVILFDIKRYLEREGEFFSFLGHTLGNWLPSSVDEQAFNAFWAGEIVQLPKSLNWRPKWGYKEDITILHVHGFKSFALSMLENDTRGLPSTIFPNYIFELVREFNLSIVTVHKYLELMAGKDHLSGTSIEYLLNYCRRVLDPAHLVRTVLQASAERGAALRSALQLAQVSLDETDSGRTLALSHPELSGITQLRIHPCRIFGFGQIDVFAGDGDLGSIDVISNSSISFSVVNRDSRSLSIRWAAIGMDCHLVLVDRANGGALSCVERVTVRQAPISEVDIFALSVDGDWRPIEIS